MLECTVLVVGAWWRGCGVVAVVLLLSGCAAARVADSYPTAPVHGLTQQISGCPDSPVAARESALVGIRDALLPFAPTRFLLCRYGGLNSGHSQALVRQVQVETAAAVKRLTAALRDGNPVWSGSGSTSCPADFGTVTTVYAQDGPRAGWLILHADRTGCPTIRNGFVNAHIGDTLEGQLTRLVGAPGK